MRRPGQLMEAQVTWFDKHYNPSKPTFIDTEGFSPDKATRTQQKLDMSWNQLHRSHFGRHGRPDWRSQAGLLAQTAPADLQAPPTPTNTMERPRRPLSGHSSAPSLTLTSRTGTAMSSITESQSFQNPGVQPVFNRICHPTSPAGVSQLPVNAHPLWLRRNVLHASSSAGRKSNMPVSSNHRYGWLAPLDQGEQKVSPFLESLRVKKKLARV
mmetsp:Transcript_30727/g.56017  ORF Transcript_30727/g.56017 Transcript_30727/m.56017 type:complete len:212 (+) Transcript_30727:104-739(+)